MVTGALHYTSQDKLNAELGWESIRHRINFLGLSLFHKVHLQETRPLIRTCMSKLDWEGNNLTRSKGGYLPHPNYGVKFTNSFFPFISKLWNNLSPTIQSYNLTDFKKHLKLETKPINFKHFSKGSKTGNTLLTRIRVGRSDLNLHKFTIGQEEKPECICHAKEESSKHYFLDCFLYTAERQTLFNLVEHYIPKFSKMTKTAKFELLINGIKPDDPDFNYLNTILTIAVQNFIIKTKRFEQ